MKNFPTHLTLLAMILGCAVLPLSGQTAGTPVLSKDSLRERISINSDWCFEKNDPPGNSVSLIYDVRPQVRDQRDDIVADTQATAADKVDASAQAVIKPWILPTGNAFIKDPARRFARPAGSWGDTVAYVQKDYDDSSWRKLNLPHDWAIEGPFIT